MKLRLQLMKVGWLHTLAYRTENIVWFVLDCIPMVYLTSLWMHQSSLGKITPAQQSYLIFYYLSTLVISRLTASEFDTWAPDVVKDGHISSHLLKPYSYKDYLFANEVSWRLSGVIFLVPSLLLLFLFAPSFLSKLPFHAQNIFAVLPILFLAFVQRLYVSYLIFLAAFWFEQVKFLSHIKWMLEGVIGGFWLPLIFLPSIVQTIAHYLPLYSWYFLPIQILSNKLPPSNSLGDYFLCIAWTIILILLSRFLWGRAIKKYSAVGN